MQDLQIQSVLIIHIFRGCRFAYLLKFIYNCQINAHGTLTAIHGGAQSDKNVGHLMHVFSVEVKEDHALPLGFNSPME